MKTLSIAILLVLALGACGKKKNEAAPPPPTTGSASAVAAGSDVGSAAPDTTGSAGSAAVAETPVDVPTEMDYEDLANEEITDKTVDARVKELEAQLAPQ